MEEEGEEKFKACSISFSLFKKDSKIPCRGIIFAWNTNDCHPSSTSFGHNGKIEKEGATTAHNSKVLETFFVGRHVTHI